MNSIILCAALVLASVVPATAKAASTGQPLPAACAQARGHRDAQPATLMARHKKVGHRLPKHSSGATAGGVGTGSSSGSGPSAAPGSGSSSTSKKMTPKGGSHGRKTGKASGSKKNPGHRKVRKHKKGTSPKKPNGKKVNGKKTKGTKTKGTKTKGSGKGKTHKKPAKEPATPTGNRP